MLRYGLVPLFVFKQGHSNLICLHLICVSSFCIFLIIWGHKIATDKQWLYKSWGNVEQSQLEPGGLTWWRSAGRWEVRVCLEEILVKTVVRILVRIPVRTGDGRPWSHRTSTPVPGWTSWKRVWWWNRLVFRPQTNSFPFCPLSFSSIHSNSIRGEKR